eukprot:7562154-Pyramimonas_sp.AAC.1
MNFAVSDLFNSRVYWKARSESGRDLFSGETDAAWQYARKFSQRGTMASHPKMRIMSRYQK